MKQITLDPGGFYFGGGTTRISTLLGSCISITLWHPWRRIGGMCHYMVSERQGHPPLDELDGRYASEAFALFLHQVAAAGSCPGEYQAKLFGGGRMFAASDSGAPEVGARNIEFGRELLAAQRIPLIAQHVGGSGRRRLHFDLHSGHVWLAFPEGSDAYIDGAHASLPVV